MVKEGCLDGVDEVYGYHNIPNFDEGDIRVCEGGFFAKVSSVKIVIKGRGGHGSSPHKLNDPINAATAVHQALNAIKSRSIDNKQNIVFTICQIKGGSVYNVFPDDVEMCGTIRSYDEPTLEVMKRRIREISEHTALAMECDAVVSLEDMYPAVINHKTETDHVIRLAKKWFGEEHFSQDELPLSASEDFSYFLMERPGCFFALGTMKVGEPLQTLHTSTYDFNDNLMASGAYFFLKIVEDRLQVNILGE